MFKQYRPLLAASLALSLLAVGGCTLQPGSFLALDQAASPAAQAKASLKVKIERPAALSTQAIANLAIELKLELPYASDPAHRMQTISVQEGQEAVFSNLPPESGYLTAIFTDIDTNAVVGTQKQNIQLRPGFETHATFTFVQGGSAALDVGVTVSVERKDLRDISLPDGLDSDYRNYQPTYWGKQFWLKTETGNVSVEFGDFWDAATNKGYITRKIGDGEYENLGIEHGAWYFIPAHAQHISDGTMLGEFDKVRHFRWENVYTVDNEPRTLLIDRWYSPTEGLLKETIQDGSGFVSELFRSGV